MVSGAAGVEVAVGKAGTAVGVGVDNSHPQVKVNAKEMIRPAMNFVLIDRPPLCRKVKTIILKTSVLKASEIIGK
jgi:hypothetical protein